MVLSLLKTLVGCLRRTVCRCMKFCFCCRCCCCSESRNAEELVELATEESDEPRTTTNDVGKVKDLRKLVRYMYLLVIVASIPELIAGKSLFTVLDDNYHDDLNKDGVVLPPGTLFRLIRNGELEQAVYSTKDTDYALNIAHPDMMAILQRAFQKEVEPETSFSTPSDTSLEVRLESLIGETSTKAPMATTTAVAPSVIQNPTPTQFKNQPTRKAAVQDYEPEEFNDYDEN